MNKKVYAIWLGNAWFTSASAECLQTTDSSLPVRTFSSEANAVAAYRSAVGCGADMFVIDNVVCTGVTASAALEVLPDATVVALAMSSWR